MFHTKRTAMLPAKIFQRLVAAMVASMFFAPAWGESHAANEVIHAHDFSGDGTTPSRKLLALRGFDLAHDLKDEDAISLKHNDGALHILAQEEAFGIMLHEEDIYGAGRMRLHWGVSEYPEGASYEHGVDNEALMVYVFFGHKKFSSGSMLVPKAPYFIGFYLCRGGTDELEVTYTGHYYEKSGSYICVAHPAAGDTVVSDIDLHEEFKKSFGLDEAPPISAVSVEVDTTDSDNDGKAAAFIKRLEFLR